MEDLLRICRVSISPANVPSEAVHDIKEALMAPGQNYGKDSYTIDLTGAEATY
jgi:hypothetical protein